MSKFTLPKINYDYTALDKYIDTETMKLHHTAHHQTYINTLNSELERLNLYKNDNLTSILHTVIEDAREAHANYDKVRNNAGGHYNHSLFWLMVSPDSNEKDICSSLMKKIDEDFGWLRKMKDLFNEKEVEVFGSGWAWLCFDVNTSKLVVCNTANQDSPLLFHKNLIPFLGLDVWEHAYYLKYRNVRKSYIDGWWNVMDWKNVSYFYEHNAVKGIVIDVKDNGTVDMENK